MSAHIGFRCDASGKIGTGHVMRCLTLATTLKHRLAGQATFFCTSLTGSLEDRLADAGHRLISLPALKSQSVETIADVHRAAGLDGLVIDGYHFDDAYRAALRQTITPIATFDDPGAQSSHADIVINTSPAAHPGLYQNARDDVQLLLGPEYALVQQSVLDQKTIGHRPQGILITFGGSDPNALTVPVTHSLRQLLPDVPLHAVVGGGVEDAKEVMNALKALPNVRVSHDLPSLGPAIGACELAVISAGTTLFEVAALGRAMVLVILAQNQSGLGDIDWADTVDVQTDFSVDRIADAVRNLWLQTERASKISARAAQLVDGQGGVRILQALLGYGQNGGQHRS